MKLIHGLLVAPIELKVPKIGEYNKDLRKLQMNHPTRKWFKEQRNK